MSQGSVPPAERWAPPAPSSARAAFWPFASSSGRTCARTQCRSVAPAAPASVQTRRHAHPSKPTRPDDRSATRKPNRSCQSNPSSCLLACPAAQLAGQPVGRKSATSWAGVQPPTPFVLRYTEATNMTHPSTRSSLRRTLQLDWCRAHGIVVCVGGGGVGGVAEALRIPPSRCGWYGLGRGVAMLGHSAHRESGYLPFPQSPLAHACTVSNTKCRVMGDGSPSSCGTLIGRPAHEPSVVAAAPLHGRSSTSRTTRSTTSPPLSS